MYSKELIKEVKECYPDYKKMHELVDNGDVMLGRYLYDNCNSDIVNILDKILIAKTLEELQEEARLIKRKIDLYEMWCDEDPRRK